VDVFAQNGNVNAITNIIYNHNIVTTIKIGVYFPAVLLMCKYISSVGNKQYLLDLNLYFI
jgi:hypothetical protein